jgi:hypothetical protein
LWIGVSLHSQDVFAGLVRCGAANERKAKRSEAKFDKISVEELARLPKI